MLSWNAENSVCVQVAYCSRIVFTCAISLFVTALKLGERRQKTMTEKQQLMKALLLLLLLFFPFFWGWCYTKSTTNSRFRCVAS